MSTSGDVDLIELRLRESSQLFNSLDPSPFRDRDLDHEAEDFIVGWARELPRDRRLGIVIHMPADQLEKAAESGLLHAFSNYFDYRANATDRDMRELFRNGRRYLAIGLPVLIICLLASQIVHSLIGANAFGRALEESLIIVGWVANWRPIETFLYDWLPLHRRSSLYRRLAAASVTLKAMPGAAS